MIKMKPQAGKFANTNSNHKQKMPKYPTAMMN